MSENWITIELTTDQMSRAIREGTIRFNLQQKSGYKTFGTATLPKHITGRLGEIVFGESYLGIPAFEDIDLEAALQRKHDVGGYQVRSTRYRASGMMIRPKDPHGTYAQVVTSDAPRVARITGWITKAEAAAKVPLTGMRENPSCKIYEVPQEMLHPFPSIGGKVMLHSCMDMQLAA